MTRMTVSGPTGELTPQGGSGETDKRGGMYTAKFDLPPGDWTECAVRLTRGDGDLLQATLHRATITSIESG